MNYNEALVILFNNGFLGGYYGPDYKSIKNIDSFMSNHPRGDGISSKDKIKLELYNACKIYKQNNSRTKSYNKKELGHDD